MSKQDTCAHVCTCVCVTRDGHTHTNRLDLSRRSDYPPCQSRVRNPRTDPRSTVAVHKHDSREGK